MSRSVAERFWDLARRINEGPSRLWKDLKDGQLREASWTCFRLLPGGIKFPLIVLVIVFLTFGIRQGLQGIDVFDPIKLGKEFFSWLDTWKRPGWLVVPLVLLVPLLLSALLNLCKAAALFPCIAETITRFGGKSRELTWIGRELLDNQIAIASQFLASVEAETGYRMPLHQVSNLGKRLLEQTHAHTIYQTTLEPLGTLVTVRGFRALTEGILFVAEKRNKQLVRVLICDDFGVFKPGQTSGAFVEEPIAWFVRKHRRAGTRLYYASTDQLIDLQRKHTGIQDHKMDVLMFDGKLVLGLLTDIQRTNGHITFAVRRMEDTEGQLKCDLFAIDDSSAVADYGRFLSDLFLNHCEPEDSFLDCGDVFREIRARGWCLDHAFTFDERIPACQGCKVRKCQDRGSASPQEATGSPAVMPQGVYEPSGVIASTLPGDIRSLTPRAHMS